MSDPTETEARLRMLQQMLDPERKKTLRMPLIQRLNEITKEHIESSRATHPGAELTPPEVIDAITTFTASFVVAYTEPGVPHGHVTLEITKMLAQKMMTAFPVMAKLNSLFGKEPS